jgi:hypothetical protein
MLLLVLYLHHLKIKKAAVIVYRKLELMNKKKYKVKHPLLKIAVALQISYQMVLYQ